MPKFHYSANTLIVSKLDHVKGSRLFVYNVSLMKQRIKMSKEIFPLFNHVTNFIFICGCYSTYLSQSFA